MCGEHEYYPSSNSACSVRVCDVCVRLYIVCEVVYCVKVNDEIDNMQI